MVAVEQQYRRAVFNIVARNQDDHVKNIAFLMDRTGNWRLSPAYDVTYSYNSQGEWTGQHQMSVAGKRDNFDRGDLMQFAKTSGIKSATANRIIDDIRTVVGNWPQYADTVDIPEQVAERIERTHTGSRHWRQLEFQCGRHHRREMSVMFNQLRRAFALVSRSDSGTLL